MTEIGFAEIVEALRTDGLAELLNRLKDGPIPPPILQQKNHVRFKSWFSGESATLLQLVAFLKPNLTAQLIDMGAEIDLHSACALGQLDAVASILKLDPQAMHRQVDKYYPIQYALRCPSTLRCLLEHGDDANRPIQKMAWFDWEDRAAARKLSDWRLIHMLALGRGDEPHLESADVLKEFGADLKAVETLLELGANVHAVDSSGFTPLHFAAGAFWQENAELVQMLLERGAVTDARDHEGNRALDLARKKNYQTIVELLR